MAKEVKIGKIAIGGENPVLKDQDISMVVSNYSLGGGMQGKLAIIGPTRMDYAKVISTLDYLTSCINDVLNVNIFFICSNIL